MMVLLLVGILITTSTRALDIENVYPLNYSLSTSINISTTHKQVVIAPDLSMGILHDSQTHFQPLLLSTTTCQALTFLNSNFSSPTDIIFYADLNNTSHIIYGNLYGFIVQKTLIQNQLKDQLVGIIPQYMWYLQIGKVVVSEDGLWWAVYTRQNNAVYAGDLARTSFRIMYQPSTVRDLTFRPGTYQLMVSIGDWGRNYKYLSGYELTLNRAYTYLIAGQSGIIMKISYASPNVFYVLEEQHQAQGEVKKYVKRYDHYTREIISYELPFDVVELICKGKYIEFRDSSGGQRVEKITKWLFTDENILYEGENELEGSTISPDGSHLLKKLKNQTSIQVLKLCNIQGYFYSQTENTCLSCLSPCSNCIHSQFRCTSCMPGYELNSQTYQCLTPQSSNNIWVVAIIVSSVLIVTIIAGVAVRYIRKNKKGKQQTTSSLMVSQQEQNHTKMIAQ